MLNWRFLVTSALFSVQILCLCQAVFFLHRSRRRFREIEDLHEKMGRELSRMRKGLGADPSVKITTGMMQMILKDGEMVVLGHDVRIRQTAIGKRFRVLHNGQEIGQFDEQDEAVMFAFQTAVQEEFTGEDLSNAPEIKIPGVGDEPGDR